MNRNVLRNAFALLIFAAGTASLAVQAVWDAPPLSAVRDRIGFFLQEDRRSRVLNSPYFSQDRWFTRTLLDLDASWPGDRDVELLVGPEILDEKAEDLRRRSAYLLAPRRVFLSRWSEGGATLRLAPGRPR